MGDNVSPLGTLAQQVSRYQQVLDVMPSGVIFLDSMGVVCEANPEARRLLGDPLRGSVGFLLSSGPSRHRKMTVMRCRCAVAAKLSLRFQLRIPGS